MKRIRKRIMPVVLALVMIIGLIPIMPEKVEAAVYLLEGVTQDAKNYIITFYASGASSKIRLKIPMISKRSDKNSASSISIQNSVIAETINQRIDLSIKDSSCKGQTFTLNNGVMEIRIPVVCNDNPMYMIIGFKMSEKTDTGTNNRCYANGEFINNNYSATSVKFSEDGFGWLEKQFSVISLHFSDHVTLKQTIQPTCTSEGYTRYSCKNCGEVITFDKQPARGHSYKDATYTWNSAHTACTGSRTCRYSDSTLTANAVVTSAVTTQPTCTTEGIRTYTATFNDANYATQTYTESVSRTGHKSISANNAIAATCTTAGKQSDEKCAVCGVTLKTGATIPATGHSYGTPTYKWSTDRKTCKAERVCTKDSSHKETEEATITSAVKTAATCTTGGVTTNTATFKNTAFVKQTKDVVTPATGHKWGTPEYVWSDDNKSCTAKVVCVDDSAHTDSETVETTSKTTDATCTDDGNTVYTADFKRIGETQTKTVNIPAVGHKYESTVVAPTILEDGYTEHTCAVCGDNYRDNYTDKIAIKSDSIVCKPFKTPVLSKADDRSLSLTDKNVEVVDADGIEHVISLKEAAKAGIIEDNVIIKDLDSETEESVKITDKDSITIKVPNFQFVITTADGIQHSSEPGRFTREDTSVKSLTLNGQDLNVTEEGFNLQLPCTTNLEDIKDVDFSITLSDVASSYSIEGSDGNYQLTVTAEEPTVTKSYSISVTNDKHDLIDTVVAPSLGKQGYTEHKCKYCDYKFKDNYVDAIEADPGTLKTSDKCKVIYTEDGKIPASTILVSFVGTDGKTYDISIKDAYDLGILGDSKIGYYVDDNYFEYNGEDYIDKVDNMRFVIKKSSEGVIEELELPSMRKARQDVSLESVTYKGNILEQNDDAFNYTAACNESKAIAVNDFNVTTSDSEALATIERVSDGQYAIHVIAEDPAYTKDYLISVKRQPHQYNKNVVEPTCKAKGYTKYTCIVCGDAYRDDVKDIVDHVYQETAVEPTCTTDGYTIFTCKWCGTEYTDNVVKALGHKEGDWIVDKQPTTSETGTRHKECSICGAITNTEDIPRITGDSVDTTDTTVNKELLDNALTSEERERVNNGESVDVSVEVTAGEVRGSLPDGYMDGYNFDITIDKKIGNDTDTKVDSLTNPVQMTTEIPASLINTDPDVQREYKVIYVDLNGNESETTWYIDNSGQLVYGCKGSGSYRVVYKDTILNANSIKNFTVKGIKYSIINGNKVKVIGANKKTIKTLSIPSTVKYNGKKYAVTLIDKKAFKNYKKLTKVTIGNKVVTIGNEAFSGCVKLSRVTIGTSIKKIGTKAFYKDKKLSSMTIKSSKLKSIGKQAIKGINSKVKIKVPKKKLAMYKKLFKSKVGYTKTMKISK